MSECIEAEFPLPNSGLKIKVLENGSIGFKHNEFGSSIYTYINTKIQTIQENIINGIPMAAVYMEIYTAYMESITTKHKHMAELF